MDPASPPRRRWWTWLLLPLAAVAGATAALWFTGEPQPLWVGPPGFQWEGEVDGEGNLVLVDFGPGRLVHLHVQPRTGEVHDTAKFDGPEDAISGLVVAGRVRWLTYARTQRFNGTIRVLNDKQEAVAAVDLLQSENAYKSIIRRLGPYIVQAQLESWIVPVWMVRVFDLRSGKFTVQRGFLGRSRFDAAGHLSREPNGDHIAFAVGSVVRSNVSDCRTYLLNANTGHLDAVLEGVIIDDNCWGKKLIAGMESNSKKQVSSVQLRDRVSGQLKASISDEQEKSVWTMLGSAAPALLGWDELRNRVVIANKVRPHWSWPKSLQKTLGSWLPTSDALYAYWSVELTTGQRRLIGTSHRLGPGRLTPSGNELIVDEPGELPSGFATPSVICYALPGSYPWSPVERFGVVVAAAVGGLVVAWGLTRKRRKKERPA